MIGVRLPQRCSIRLCGYDYSQEGLYFVTICTQDKACLFGNISDDEIVLNDVGKIAKHCWLSIPQHFSNAALHEFVIMPNHIHGIIEIVEANKHSSDDVKTNKHSPDDTIRFKSPSKTIGSMIRGFKIGVMKQYKEYITRANINSPLQQTPSIWQRNYYEHIIRNEESYRKITEYIYENPKRWQTDDYYK
ncbi:transposase [Dysgonomonas sp. BGC7]|uniref:transposase n=1 Tax=Dysgonomonas sp. BGC7 TaxID=1658008 RepID=UPI00068283BA|nr:transposase [Dysgonomonas sp. BGC7]MBD8388249.1 hypothetical protein [Dysgonomonas sp. BGC7]